MAIIEKVKGMEWAAVALLGILVCPLFIRSRDGFKNAGQDCINIYDQQYQMAQFVHRFYDTAGVAFNDIGAVSYYSQGRKLDFWGIANVEVLKSRKEGYWSPVFADSLAGREHVRIAIIYDGWFKGLLLPHWRKVASWTIPNNLIAAFDNVSFYAVDSTEAPRLKANLQAFQPSLPRDVVVRYR